MLCKKIDDRLLIAIGLALLGTSSLIFGFESADFNDKYYYSQLYFRVWHGLFNDCIKHDFGCHAEIEQMTNAAGIQALLKNIGGAIGMSIMATMISRFSQVHQFMMVAKLKSA